MSARQQFIPQKTLTNSTENSTLMKPPSVPSDLETPGNFDTNRALNISGLLKSKKKASLSFTPEKIHTMDHQDTSQSSRKSPEVHQQQSSTAAFSVHPSPRLLFKERKNRKHNATAHFSTPNSTQSESSATEGQNMSSLFSSSTTASTLNPSSFFKPDLNSATKLDENTTHTSTFVTRPPTAATAFNLQTEDKTAKDPTLELSQSGPDFDDTLELTSPQNLFRHGFMESNPSATDPPEMLNKHSASRAAKRARVTDDDRGVALNWKKQKADRQQTRVDPGYAQDLTSEYQPAHTHVDTSLAQAQKHLYCESSLAAQDDFDGKAQSIGIRGSSTPKRSVQQKASRHSASHPRDLAPQAPPRAVSAFDTLFDIDLDAYIKVHLAEYEAEKMRWATCEMKEWVNGADEIAAEFGALLDFVKDNMSKTLKSFASINQRLADHNTELDGRGNALEEVQKSLQKNGGQLI